MRDVADQLRILKRGVEQIVPEPEFLKKLERSVREDRPLRVKYGIDPDRHRRAPRAHGPLA